MTSPRPFPWNSLPKVSAHTAAATREALRRLAPSPPRPDEALAPRWRALLGGEVRSAPGVPACITTPAAPHRDVFAAVFERDDGALVLAMIDRTLARAVASRALSLPSCAPDAPISAAEEGALMALCAKASVLVCAPGPPLRVRAVTDDPDDALHALRDAAPHNGEWLRWPWAVHTADASGEVTLLLPPRAAPPWPFAPRASVLGASALVSLEVGRARWPVGEVASLTVGDLLALDGLRLHRGELHGGAELSAGIPEGPVFSGTLTPIGARIDAPATLPGAPVMPAPDAPTDGPAIDTATLNALPVELTVELGQRACTVGEVASWRVGAVVEFPTVVGEQALLRAGGRPIARGELVEVEGRVGLRVTELL